MSLEGDFADFNLTDILQLVHWAKKTGVLEISNESRSCVIYFLNGDAVHAINGALEGEKAVYDIFHWEYGNFSFKAGKLTNRRTINIGLHNLIMEATRLIDEWTQIKKVIPSLDSVIRIRGHPSEEGVANIKLKSEEWKILSCVNGIRNVKEIAALSGFSDFQACKVLYGLILSGLLEVVEELPEAQLVEEKLTTEKLEHKKGISKKSKRIKKK